MKGSDSHLWCKRSVCTDITFPLCVRVQGILCKQSAGQLTLEHLVHTGDVMMASTSELGQNEVRQDVANAQQQFEEFFNGTPALSSIHLTE